MHDVEDFENMPRARKVEVPYSAFCSECFTLFALSLQSFRFLSLSPGLGTAEEHLCIYVFSILFFLLAQPLLIFCCLLIVASFGKRTLHNQ